MPVLAIENFAFPLPQGARVVHEAVEPPGDLPYPIGTWWVDGTEAEALIKAFGRYLEREVGLRLEGIWLPPEGGELRWVVRAYSSAVLVIAAVTEMNHGRTRVVIEIVRPAVEGQ